MSADWALQAQGRRNLLIGLAQRDGAITRVRPRGAWVASAAVPTRGVSRLHLVTFARAIWLPDETVFYAGAKCGWTSKQAVFHIEPPHDDLCDACVFIDGAKPTVYRLYDGEGRLLYIGYSAIPSLRVLQHAKTFPWFTDIRSWRLTEYDDQRTARAAELRAIYDEQPLYNLRGWCERRGRRKAASR